MLHNGEGCLQYEIKVLELKNKFITHYIQSASKSASVRLIAIQKLRRDIGLEFTV